MKKNTKKIWENMVFIHNFSINYDKRHILKQFFYKTNKKIIKDYKYFLKYWHKDKNEKYILKYPLYWDK